ncbi:hypothetical protein AM479_005638 [Pseudomonas aeruginosa]|uniref:hypothetical protein n=1 Tax=Pseudomonas aeruginosa TaxID=287 RepID=UPI0008FB5542|nr:hypothetical protein [Pseudomonas aeruginosa]OKN93561.1 hypothetical protein AM479_005638 [Pseudomonas aeruginosa]
MSEKPVVAPFQLSVMAALSVVGSILGSTNKGAIDKVVEHIETIKSKMPADASLRDGSSEHHLALDALISGLRAASKMDQI